MKIYIPLRSLLVMVMLITGTLLSATTVYVVVNGVYHDKDTITIDVVANDMIGTSDNIDVDPTVYCCGQQTIIWDNFEFYGCTATFTATQGTRSAFVSGVYVYGEMPWTIVTISLPLIPDYPHKNEN